MKEAIALKNLGHTVYLITNNKEITRQLFDLCIVYTNIKQLELAIKFVAPHTEIFHVHNEPNYPATIIRELVPDAKIVLDLHDSNYWRIKPLPIMPKYLWPDEDIAVECSDAMVFPSNAAMEDFKTRHDKPMIFLPAAFNLNQLRYKPTNCLGGIVSQGGHALPNEMESDNYRDYTKVYSDMASRGIQVYAYSLAFANSDNDLYKHYSSLGITLGYYFYEQMLSILNGHFWNMVGNIGGHYVWNFSLPNKFYDACAAGLPSVNFSNPEVAKLIDEYDIGINVKDVEELIQRWPEHREKRKNLMLYRKELAMEKHIGKLETLYGELCK